MPILTDHFRGEARIIQRGLSQLEKARRSLSRLDVIEDLRATTYSLRLLFERTHLTKLEAILYPALDSEEIDESEQFDEATERLHNGRARLSILRLQISLDRFAGPSERAELISGLESCIVAITRALENEADVALPLADRLLNEERQEQLYLDARDFDRKFGLERVAAAQALVEIDYAQASGD